MQCTAPGRFFCQPLDANARPRARGCTNATPFVTFLFCLAYSGCPLFSLLFLLRALLVFFPLIYFCVLHVSPSPSPSPFFSLFSF